ncbi:alpha-2-macroglobulin-like [Neolamprologus brichardi]|uniref:alpha-2-macroglobulin-like n=1 Tax=Neolamprologus brichardi TaxID=32507 RepID=UPI001643B5B0|nr:alpha-2-macroglobulin-like [Neolamprologus brichardi]
MGCSRILTWTLSVLLSWICVDQAVAEPQYLVAIPAVIEAGAETKFCASLLQPSETVVMTVTLMSREENTTLLTHTSNEEFHTCTQFKAPSVEGEKILDFEVEVRGDTFHSKEVRKVMIKAYKARTFIQTDKPLYLPGQTVHFRVVALDSKLRPVSQLCNIIELENPNRNRIGQWLNETSNNKILQLSYSLNSEAHEGTYKIIVSVGEDKFVHKFKVEKYVLPKFDITVNVSEEVSIGQEEVDIKLCAKYTFGQPVPGSITVTMCRLLERSIASAKKHTIEAPCHTETKRADGTGCAAVTFKMSIFTKINKKFLKDQLNVIAKMEEEGTGISRKQEMKIRISFVLGKASFVDVPKIWEPGSNVEGKVKAVYYNDTHISKVPVYLFVGERWSERLLENLTTDSNGVAEFSFSTDNFHEDIKLSAALTPTLYFQRYRTPFYDLGYHTVYTSQPPQDEKTFSSLKLKMKDKPLSCDAEEDISIQYTIVRETAVNMDVVYLVLSRGAIVMQGFKQIKFKDQSVNEGEVSFKLRISTDMAPVVQIVAYVVLSSTNVIAHSADFSTEKCFSHKVSLDFTPSSTVPGEKTNMEVTALPHSLCGLSAIDKSVLIKEPDNILDADKIFNLLPVMKASYFPYRLQEPRKCLKVRTRRYSSPIEDNEAYIDFQRVGLKVATNLLLEIPSCLSFMGREYRFIPSAVGSSGGSLGPSEGPMKTVRAFFPETWIWDLVEVGESGSKDVSLTVPDTITTWETEAFCLSSQGFGLAPRQEVEVFQPFFLELTMPHSIIRGEHFELKATVFNYLTSCIMVTVFATPSSDYTLTPLSGEQYTSCLCAKERKTVSWTMIPTVLGAVNVTVSAEAVPSHVSCDNEVVRVPERGRIDVVTKSFIVKAEGTEMTKTSNWLLCPKGDTLTEETEIQLPENVIEGSARTFVSVLGKPVSLDFTPSSTVPGEKTNMEVTALPHSLCGLSAIDKSVLIKEPDNILDADKIFNLLPVMKASYFPYRLQEPRKCLKVRTRRYSSPIEDNEAYIDFQRVGLKVATNLLLEIPSCLSFMGREYRFIPSAVGSSGGSLGPSEGPMKTVRAFFPETWIWDLVEVGESGSKDVSLTVPDTITTWETEAFCLSSQGFGLAPRQEVEVFQPFFLELTMPHSIIRGEHFELKATVFNYLTSCIMVTVFATPSSDYTLTPLSGEQYTSCLCAKERKTVSWTMIPTVLGAVNVTVSAEAVPSHVSCDNEVVRVPERGRIDVVTKSFIVKAEGTEMTKTSNWLLCPKGDTLTEETEIQLPENVIEGSARTFVSVLGDILGRALKNLDGLLRMPYGCGEQNMALLAPNIYILQYLKGTQQLTPAIMEKAANFLTSGYQRQLNYKSTEGAYTTFGRGPGNTWLTAFVMRSFAKAQSFVYIDPKIIQESKTWLENKQQANGCFKKSGKLFNNRMKGGVSDEVTLSAYITAAFLEMNISKHDPVVNNSLACLRASINDLSNTYTTALLAYVFTLAGDTETRAHLLQHLDTVAVREGGFLYWSQTAAETSASLSVEISSYVLLAKLSASATADDLGYTSGIIRWLTGQQNYYGGFSSTQDTVAALQALALYSTLVFSPEGSSTVTVQSDSSQLTFDVNPGNKLLYQEETMQVVSGKYSLEVKGTTCVSVQISVHYNIPSPTDVTTLSVEVKSEVDPTSEYRRKLTLTIKSLYSGKENTTNMVILDIKMLSGFVPNEVSLKMLKGAPLVDRVEQTEDHVLVYLQELPKDIPMNYSLTIIEELRVENLKPAMIKIYDYYQPSDQAETEYIYPSAAA